MKGIILAGGRGTRLYPATKAVSKQLLPIYDKPLIYYPLSVLMLAGIRDILIISTPADLPRFRQIFDDGSRYGLRLSYMAQDRPAGIGQAFTLGERFIGDDCVCLILGDNIFYGNGLISMLSSSVDRVTQGGGAVIYGYTVKNPQDFGIIEFDDGNRAVSIVEKPKNPRSNTASVGLYFYDNDVVRFAKQAEPSDRGEYEITDINNRYLEEGRLQVQLLYRGFAWLDAGSHESMLEASHFIHTIEQRQGLKIACIEEIAFRKRFIGRDELKALARGLCSSQYGRYLMRIVEEV